MENNDIVTRAVFNILRDAVKNLHDIYNVIREQTVAITKLAEKQDFMEKEHLLSYILDKRAVFVTARRSKSKEYWQENFNQVHQWYIDLKRDFYHIVMFW